MNRLNVKRIAVLASALIMGAAVAGSVSFQGVPIINNAGTPVVQIVVGSGAKPSDALVAGNIAAVIGNLAYTSQPVTAVVNGKGGVSCTVTTPTCTVSNAQVYLSEKGSSSVKGGYGFTALIGSVLNGAIQQGAPLNTKKLQSTSSYAYYDNPAVTSAIVGSIPTNSPFAQSSGYSMSLAVSSSSNGGGATFSSLNNGNYDNLLLVSNAYLPSLLSNSGANGESEFLWLAGFPVYDQATSPSVQSFALLDAGGAYQITFSKPIHEPYYTDSALGGNAPGTNSINNAQFTILGQPYSIVNYKLSSTTASSTSAISGTGSILQLAQSLTNVTTVYVGQNITSGNFTVQLQDLGHTSGSNAPAILNVYYNGKLTNNTSVLAPNLTTFNVSGQKLVVDVKQTAAGLYANAKWAKLQLYSNVFNVTSGSEYNKTYNPGWNAYLLWTNSSGNGHPTDLYSIILLNTSPVSQLLPGQSFQFIQKPKAYKLTFIGDTIGTNFDTVDVTTNYASSVNYANSGQNSTALTDNITEPSQELTVSSQIPNAFSDFGGVTASSVTYLLTPMQLNTFPAVNKNTVGAPANIVLSDVGTLAANAIDKNYFAGNGQLQLKVLGYTSATNAAAGGTPVTLATGTFNAIGSNIVSTANVYNVTQIDLTGAALPGLEVTVYNSLIGDVAGNVVANLAPVTGKPVILYSTPNQNYYSTVQQSYVSYNQQNGQSNSIFSIDTASEAVGTTQNAFFQGNLTEFPVATSTSNFDAFEFDVVNTTGGYTVSNLYELNYSTSGQHQNVTYLPSGLTSTASFSVPVGFISERGSKVANIQPHELTFDMAKAVDTLQFAVSAEASNVSTSAATYGPYKVGQNTNIANVSIASVNASCTGGSASSSSCTVSGLSNLSATPSVASAITPVVLNTATTPLVVLDSAADQASTLIVVGSKYVNSVAGQIFAQQTALNQSFGPSSVIAQAYGTNRILVAGYYANQTVTAGNEFINALLSAAGQ